MVMKVLGSAENSNPSPLSVTPLPLCKNKECETEQIGRKTEQIRVMSFWQPQISGFDLGEFQAKRHSRPQQGIKKRPKSSKIARHFSAFFAGQKNIKK